MSTDRRIRLTDRFVRAVQPRSTDSYYPDDQIPNFRLKVTPKGRKVFIFSYRNIEGRQRTRTLGHSGSHTAAAARLLARETAALVAQGKDPQAERQAIRNGVTMREAFDAYFAWKVHHWRPTTAQENRRIFEIYVNNTLKGCKLSGIQRADLANILHRLHDTPHQANAVRALLRAFFNWCEGDGGFLVQGTSPARALKGYPSTKRSFVFEGNQLLRLSRALDEAERTQWPPAVAAIRLLLMTGMRKNEVLRLTWGEVDVARRRILLSSSKTGPRSVHLGKGALEILEKQAAQRMAWASEFVFPSPRDRGRPIVGIQRIWDRIRSTGDLRPVRLHDLRHNFGSVGAERTRSAVHVKGLLGHTQIGTTDRYMNLAQAPLFEAADEVTEAIAGRMKPENAARFGERNDPSR